VISPLVKQYSQHRPYNSVIAQSPSIYEHKINSTFLPPQDQNNQYNTSCRQEKQQQYQQHENRSLDRDEVR
jgi:hypothetical protein